MTEHVVTDEFGRKTLFTGEHLVCETTDNVEGTKPQWVDVDVWRTEAGKFVVRRVTRYRIRHLVDTCPKADGYDLAQATAGDTHPCPTCNVTKDMFPGSGWAQTPRIAVDVYDTPQDLVRGFATEGRYNYLARTVLAEVASQDERVDAVWNTVVVP